MSPSSSSSTQTSFAHWPESARLWTRCWWLRRSTCTSTSLWSLRLSWSVKSRNLHWQSPPWKQSPPFLPPPLGQLLVGGDQGDALVVEGLGEERQQHNWTQSWHWPPHHCYQSHCEPIHHQRLLCNLDVRTPRQLAGCWCDKVFQPTVVTPPSVDGCVVKIWNN